MEIQFVSKPAVPFRIDMFIVVMGLYKLRVAIARPYFWSLIS